jgi:hypothetical protein
MTDFDVSAAAEKYRELRTALDALLKSVQAEIKVAARDAISAAATAFFARHPGVHGIRWTQYTPYFNDGDACEFSAHDPDLEIIKGTSRRGESQQNTLRTKEFYLKELDKAKNPPAKNPEDDVIGYRRYDRPKSQTDLDRYQAEVVSADALIDKVGGLEAFKAIVADFNVISRFILDFNDDDLELVFGDHVQVFVSKDGITVEEYEHD